MSNEVIIAYLIVKNLHFCNSRNDFKKQDNFSDITAKATKFVFYFILSFKILDFL
jgi:hypothetical protein